MSMDDRREVLYIVSVLKSASNLVELDIQVTINTLFFLCLSFYFTNLSLCFRFILLTLIFYNLE